jgi:outer membrane protein assembly factor BamB
MARFFLLTVSLIGLILIQFSLVWGLRLTESSFPTRFGNALRNVHIPRRAICITPPPYDVVLTEAWKATYPDASSVPLSPVLDEQVTISYIDSKFKFIHILVFLHISFQGNLYIRSSFGVTTLNALTGAQVNFFVTSAPIPESFSVFDDRIVFGTDNSVIHSVQLSDMTETWFYPLPNSAVIRGSALTDGNLLFFMDTNGYLHAVDPSNGAQVWNASISSSASDIALLDSQFDSLGEPTILVAKSYPPQLIRLFSKNGTEVWRFSLTNDTNDALTTKYPYVLGNLAYLGVYLNANRTTGIWIINVTSRDNYLIPPAFDFDSYSNTTYPVTPAEPLVVINDEVIYGILCQPVKRRSELVGACGTPLVSTKNNTSAEPFLRGILFSDPDNLLMYFTGQSVVGYHYPDRTQKVWYNLPLSILAQVNMFIFLFFTFD